MKPLIACSIVAMALALGGCVAESASSEEPSAASVPRDPTAAAAGLVEPVSKRGARDPRVRLPVTEPSCPGCGYPVPWVPPGGHDPDPADPR